jgi:Na+/H+ antiporter NhaC
MRDEVDPNLMLYLSVLCAAGCVLAAMWPWRAGR